MDRIQVKICGITTPETARLALDLGVDAVGLVFFDKSPRHVSREMARVICNALPGRVARVGVFVNLSPEEILACVRETGITHAQLHGVESNCEVLALEAAGIRVIKALFLNMQPGFSQMGSYGSSAFLLECARGALPGGNGLSWNFQKVRDLRARRPVVLAGGLTPETVSQALISARPDAVDVSSGVESTPGVKDPVLMRRFMEAVRNSRCTATRGRAFS